MKYRENQKKNSSPRISPLSIATFNKSVNRCRTILKVGEIVAKEYLGNKEFYNDFIKFNCFNSISSPKVKNTKISIRNIPEKVKGTIAQAYRVFKNDPYPTIFLKLGTRQSFRNKNSPVEAKWAYTYFKKFRTWEFSEYNRVSVAELLSPLASSELEDYLKYF